MNIVVNTSDLFSAEYAQNEAKDDQIVQNDAWHRQQPTVVQRSMSQRAPVTMTTVAKQQNSSSNGFVLKKPNSTQKASDTEIKRSMLNYHRGFALHTMSVEILSTAAKLYEKSHLSGLQ